MEPQIIDGDLDEQNPFLLCEEIPARDDEIVKQSIEKIGIPPYAEPDTYAGDFETTTLWVPDHEHMYTISIDNNDYDIHVSSSGKGKALVHIKTDIDDVAEDTEQKLFWTCVHLCRHIGIPGVAKESIRWNNTNYRIGGLYRYAGFSLLEREWNYRSYGERHITEYENGLSQFHGDVGGDEETEKQKEEAEDRYGSYSLRDAYEQNSHAQSLLQAGDSDE